MLPETNSPIDFLPIDTFNLLSLDKGSSYVIERFLNADTAILEIKWDATKDELKQAEHVYMRRALRGRKTYFVIDPDKTTSWRPSRRSATPRQRPATTFRECNGISPAAVTHCP